MYANTRAIIIAVVLAVLSFHGAEQLTGIPFFGSSQGGHEAVFAVEEAEATTIEKLSQTPVIPYT